MILTGLSGLLAGSVHVVGGPDHLAAVAPLAMESHRQPWRVGLRWGFGHALGVVFVGLLALLLRQYLPVEKLSGWAEWMVGLVLIGIGIWGLRRVVANPFHIHRHEHGGQAHEHAHEHADRKPHALPQAHAHLHTAFAVGTLHGCAGSSHFLAVVPALGLPTMAAAVTYLACYGIGTIGAMMAFSAVIGTLVGRLAVNGLKVYRISMAGLSLVAIGVGVFWLCH